jgi:hypothetical protein
MGQEAPGGSSKSGDKSVFDKGSSAGKDAPDEEMGSVSGSSRPRTLVA